MTSQSNLLDIDPESIVPNPHNPRRYFNEERLDLLRTSIQEVGVLVPIIVYEQAAPSDGYVLMDGERRWRCSLDLALEAVPANRIDPPSPLDNLLRMFNIHNVREDWPLISVALSLQDVMQLSGESGEKRLAQMTGLTRATVRRAKRLLTIPDHELELIRNEAHLDRAKQIHREDLYLEIEAAESVLRSELPEIASSYERSDVIRRFAEKAEVGSLTSVTDFRFVGRLAKAADDELVRREDIVNAALTLIERPDLSPRSVFDDVAATAYEHQAVLRKSELLVQDIRNLDRSRPISSRLRFELSELRSAIDQLLGDV